MRMCFGLLAIGFLSLGALAQTKPDFSGTWKLDLLRSRFGQIPEPKETVLKIEQQDPKLVITITNRGEGGETTETLDLTTDNAVHQETIGGQPATATAQWDQWTGKRLVWKVTQDTPDGPVVTTRRVKLGEKGKILTTVLSIKDKSGERKAYEFYVKQ
jgi:hypothetical protein